MSTLLEDLDKAVPSQGGDEDFVQNILREMNGGVDTAPPPPQPSNQMPSPSQFLQPPPAVGAMGQAHVIQAPNPNTLSPHTMDNGPITAHMIGNSHPTAADFASMMQGSGGVPASMMASYSQGGGVGMPNTYVAKAGKKGFFTRILDEFKSSLLVALLVFTFSLPVVNFLFAHYLPRLVKPTGELTPIGLVVKSLAAGGAFWLLQRVVVPLLSL